MKAMPTTKGRKLATSITITQKELVMAYALMGKLGFTSFSSLIGYLLREKYKEVFNNQEPEEVIKETRTLEEEILQGRPPSGRYGNFRNAEQ